MESARARAASPIRRLATAVHGAHENNRMPLLDGPRWFGLLCVALLADLTLAPEPWKWLAVPFVVAFIWLPLAVRWAIALRRSVGVLREQDRP